MKVDLERESSGKPACNALQPCNAFCKISHRLLSEKRPTQPEQTYLLSHPLKPHPGATWRSGPIVGVDAFGVSASPSRQAAFENLCVYDSRHDAWPSLQDPSKSLSKQLAEPLELESHRAISTSQNHSMASSASNPVDPAPCVLTLLLLQI